jgi:hypothetical protein
MSTETKVIYRNEDGDVTSEQHMECVYALHNIIEAAREFCEKALEDTTVEDAGKFRFVAAGLKEAQKLINPLLIN